MSTLFWASYIAVWVVAVAAVIGVLALLNHFGAMYSVTPDGRRDQGPAEGSFVKSAEVRDIKDRAVPIPIDAASVLLFVSSDCSSCSALRPALYSDVPGVDNSRVLVICHGSVDMVTAWARGLPDRVHVIADPRNKLGIRFEIDVVPFGVAVSREGLVMEKGIANDATAIAALLAAASGLVRIEPTSDLGPRNNEERQTR